jgi:hypothetical protein
MSSRHNKKGRYRERIGDLSFEAKKEKGRNGREEMKEYLQRKDEISLSNQTNYLHREESLRSH